MVSSRVESMRTIVAMSGGIDSSTAAYLLLRDGHEVVGLTLRMRRVERGASVDELVERAASICRAIGIEHVVMDVSAEFEKQIVQPFCRQYVLGRTPNPCIECNKFMKFPSLWSEAQRRGAQKIATGHYARVTEAEGGRFHLRKGIDATKDQSYLLYGLAQEMLSRIAFPLGERRKKDIREKVREFWPWPHLPAESQEICFLQNSDYALFVRDRERTKPGVIVDTAGHVLGRHDGVHGFTIGQRRGLGFAAGKPLYVVRIDPSTNTVVVGDRSETYRREFIVGNLNWCSVPPVTEPRKAMTKVRYAHPVAEADLHPEPDGSIRVTFAEPQHAVTPGQSAVFYEEDVVLGGGIID
jgi:tRNA-specific 2-thiouridylase